MDVCCASADGVVSIQVEIIFIVLVNAFEGRRANPRSKPPFPAAKGLWGRPTTVHNVETLSCVPAIVANGADWWKKLGATPEAFGTKLYGGSGALERPACIERPMGVTLRSLNLLRQQAIARLEAGS